MTTKLLSNSQEKTTKKLAELKSYLEKRVSDQEAEVRNLRSYLETVDSLLAEKSYRKVQLPQPSQAPTPQPFISQPPLASSQSPPLVESSQPQSIRTISGVHLANIFVEGHDMRVVPSGEIRFDANAPPLRSFLVGKVLEPLKVKDEEATRKQELTPDDVLSYEIDKEGAVLKQIHVKNYGDERRLNELKNAVRWTFRRMYEKTIGTQ